MKLNKKIEKYANMFEGKTREDGTNYVVIKGDDEELLHHVREAHGDKLPDDWTFATFADLLYRLQDYNVETIDDIEEIRHELVESYIDIYTSDLTKWLANRVSNVYYLTEALEEHGTTDGITALQMAQFIAIDTLMQEVINLLN